MRHLTLPALIFAGFFAISCSTESIPAYQLSTNTYPTEGGTIAQATPDGEKGKSITITANPTLNWLFDGWEGDIPAQTNPINIIMDRDKSISARFVLREYPLTVQQVGEGEITEEVVQKKTTDYSSGTTVRLHATASEFWMFDGWSGDVDDSSQELIIELKEPTSVFATFLRAEYSMEASVSGSGFVETKLLSGTETGNNGYASETVLELKALASPGWRFVEWDGDLTGSNEVEELLMDSDKEVTAIFEVIYYNVTTETEGDGNITVDPQQESYRSGQLITFNAEPSEGSEFLRWSGSFSRSARSVELEIEEDLVVKAIFSPVVNELKYQFSKAIILSGRVHEASLTLSNNLPDHMVLDRFELKSREGAPLTSANDDIRVEAGESTGYTLKFGIPPTEEAFSNYIVVWHVTYKGREYRKETKAGLIGYTAKKVEKDLFLREIIIE